MLEKLTQNIGNIFSKIGGGKKLTENNISDAIRQIRLALIEADVNILAIKKFINNVKEKSIGEKVIKEVATGDMFIKLLHDSLVEFLGGEYSNEIQLREPTQTSHILFSGLQGAGKTTTLAKLANILKKKREILTVSLDIYRPAAAKQLKVLSEQVGVSYFDRGEEKDIPTIIKNTQQFAKDNFKNCILFDTAGRTQVDEDMLAELKDIYKILSPSENIFVCDSMIGQTALDVAEKFKSHVQLDSLIFTKFDSDTRGGAVLSVKQVLDVPIKYIGTGEKIDGIDEFVPSRIADRILGMGDIVGLVNKAKEAVDEKESQKLLDKIKNNELDLNDFLQQLNQMKKLGSMKSIMGMIPGLAGKVKDTDVQEEELTKIKIMIQSMTKQERKNVYLLNNNSRKVRIAKGSGKTILDLNKVLKKFQEFKNMMRKMNNPTAMKKMMRQMGMDNMDQDQTDKLSQLLEKTK